ncbi:lytic polysaccharide monooxygenase [Citrobacter amalonaticus]|uniref:lytic polysaccharide monooxygenase n=1 Tax=Citrobacter amalonaticus TaxID=35703 RepID=UPI00300D8F57
MKSSLANKISLLASLIAAVSGCVTTGVYAHGYISSPPSRIYECNLGRNTDCGSGMYEPQSVEGPKGFPEGGPADGFIASGQNEKFHPLDVQTPDRWVKVKQSAGDIKFEWTLTASHKSESWDYYITKTGWDNANPLTRKDFELVPFCHYDGNNITPPSKVTHSCTIPADRKGYHVILGVWSIADTSNAFYQAIDVNIN